ncbi:hypothetical protein [Nonomuraea cavernae]|uniref:hypothetical protein n=1 Tax=Nonomuraea cavernae TaxID=2045107 RepID=UPI00166E6F2E|nr:hypothetical protein [Nonomuraea cavernae]MCA2186605.1 hypothetical protein [Nonomuraea cavernae]
MPRPGESPDEAARRVSGVAPGAAGVVVHSTSWRHLPEGVLVLTYAVCPDPAPWLPAVELARLEIARGSAPATPTPERIEAAHVAAHAVRHLAFLVARDPVVREALLRHRGLVAALASADTSDQHGVIALDALAALDAAGERDLDPMRWARPGPVRSGAGELGVGARG